MRRRRSFLFLQGPVGSFFASLGAELRARGHEVRRINFNGGDLVSWRSPGASSFRHGAETWPAYLRDLVEREGLEDVVLFGDCRPRHAIARRVLRPLGVRLHVFEEGYFRPDWITHEVGGVNAHSALPREPGFYIDAAASLPDRGRPGAQPVGPSQGGLTRAACHYYAASAALRPWFGLCRSHRPWDPLSEGLSWLGRAVVLPSHRRAARSRQAALLDDPRPFFLLALQLDADMQIRRHSGFAGMSEVIVETVRSFARAAHPAARLVVKNHPLDCGRIDFETLLAGQAAKLGLAERVVYLDGGDLPLLLSRASGMVVVNSTAGLSSIHHGVPTIVLGRAVYDMRGLTHEPGGAADPDRLDRFWRCPEPPDSSLYRAFRRVVMARTQINGGFYTERGLRLAVPRAAERVEIAG